MSSEFRLNAINSNQNNTGGKQLSNIRSPRTSAGAPLALIEDDADLPPERPTAGPEVDDLIGNSEVDDMLPPSTNNHNKNDFPGVDDALIPRRENDFPIPDNSPFPEVPEVGRKLPDINVYQKKKIFAQGMMDLALLTANANQLRYVLDAGSDHTYFYVNLTCIAISILLQVTVGILLLWNSRFNINKEPHIILADRINNFTVIGIFLITILNVFISAFGLPDRSAMIPLGMLSQQVQSSNLEVKPDSI